MSKINNVTSCKFFKNEKKNDIVSKACVLFDGGGLRLESSEEQFKWNGESTRKERLAKRDWRELAREGELIS